MISRDFLGNTWEYDCMGCAIARQARSGGVVPPERNAAGTKPAVLTVPGGFIRQTGNFCVHQDPLIPLPGFLVIGSTRHIRSLGEMVEVEYAEFTGLVRQTQAAIKKATQVEYLTLIQEEHSIHFHLWFFPWLPDISKKHGEPSLAKIRGIMEEVSRQPISKEEWRELKKVIDSIKTIMK